MKEISIVIPVYNSNKILYELNNQIEKTLPSSSYELILVNDCSKDNSWEIIKNICSKNKNVSGINLRINSGQDNAIMAGLNRCIGKYVVIMDDDLQHSPTAIPLLINQLKSGYDVCYAKFKKKKQKIWKNLGSWLNGKIAEIIINKPKKVYLSPFEALKHEVVEEIIKYKGPYPYVQGLILSITKNVTQINVEHLGRYSGKSNFNFLKSMTVFLKLATSFSVFPLRISTYLGFLSALTGFLVIPYIIYQYFIYDHIVEGWTSIAILILTIGGLILFCLGIIGEYIGRLFLTTNSKPQFTIKEIITSKDD